MIRFLFAFTSGLCTMLATLYVDLADGFGVITCTLIAVLCAFNYWSFPHWRIKS